MTRISEGSASAQRILQATGPNVLHTGKVAIGSALIPRARIERTRDDELLQTALLDARTACQPSLWRRALAPLWRLC